MHGCDFSECFLPDPKFSIPEIHFFFCRSGIIVPVHLKQHVLPNTFYQFLRSLARFLLNVFIPLKPSFWSTPCFNSCPDVWSLSLAYCPRATFLILALFYPLLCPSTALRLGSRGDWQFSPLLQLLQRVCLKSMAAASSFSGIS